ncbi:hypothetical protein RKD47_004669 [Streptomyces albogriseolus]
MLPESVGVNAFQFSSPLEDIADPNYSTDWLSNPIGPVLRDFVTGSQSGARKVALRIFQLAMRTMIFAYAGPVWQKVDALSPYFLQGWRSEVPSYVRDAMAGKFIAPEISGNIAGIVVLQL